MRLRVTPLPASSRPVRVAFPGCPFRAPFLLNRHPNPQVAPWFRSFGCAGDECSSCPERLMPSAMLVSAKIRVAPSPASSCNAPDVGLGFPLVLHLRLYRRWFIESPRCSHLSAVPSCQSSSRPEYQPFGIADDSSSRLPRTSNLPVPIDGYPGYPGSHTYRFALVEAPSCPGSSFLGYGN